MAHVDLNGSVFVRSFYSDQPQLGIAVCPPKTDVAILTQDQKFELSVSRKKPVQRIAGDTLHLLILANQPHDPFAGPGSEDFAFATPPK